MISCQKVSLKDILVLREIFLAESNFQIRYDSVHRRGWSDSYQFLVDGAQVGYGSIRGNENHSDRDTIFEFYVLPGYQKFKEDLFSSLLTASGARHIECQSNEPQLTSMIYLFATSISSDVILFGDDSGHKDSLISDATFRKHAATDSIFDHHGEPKGDFVLEFNSEVVATGGFLLHYNKPFADLYMEVRDDMRKRGFGSFLIQELRRQCKRQGLIPAARCSAFNLASRATLLKGGLKMVGEMMFGQFAPPSLFV